MTAGLVSQATGTLPGVPCGDPAGGLIVQQYTLNGGTGQRRDAAPGDNPFRIPWLATGKLLTVPDGSGLYVVCHDVGGCDLSTRQAVADTFLAGTLRRRHTEWAFFGMTDQNIWPARRR